MKPLGPIPAGYAAIGGELAIGGARVSHWAEQAGRTPLFVYSKELIAQRFADLRDQAIAGRAGHHEALGRRAGDVVGDLVGLLLGDRVGELVGLCVGDIVGVTVGGEFDVDKFFDII